jgi:tRNA threonylcarbamoyl adenosine modification protein YjeE
MSVIKTIEIGSLQAMEHEAVRFAKTLRTLATVALSGDLGAGKTVFARGFVRALCGAEIEVVSPTFTLMQEYKTFDGRLITHFDLYRLKQESELEELGFSEAIERSITLIEWPKLAERYLPADTLFIDIEHAGGDVRRLKYSERGSYWQAHFDRIKGVA